jgi:short-subunit dehydrogenase
MGALTVGANHDGKVALITGAGSGIGRELARVLSGEGMTIAAIDKNAQGLISLDEELRAHKRTVSWEVADVTDIAGLRGKVAELENRLGPVRLLIANAGIGIETSAAHLQAEDLLALVQVNLFGVANSIAAVLPGMLQRRQGHIVGISSLASLRGLPRLFGYCASKAGVNALLEGLRVEVRRYNIHVTTICPGWIRTPMTDAMKGRIPLMDVNVAARQIATAIRRRRRFYAFPHSTAWTLLLLRLLPATMSDWLVARMMGKLKE